MADSYAAADSRGGTPQGWGSRAAGSGSGTYLWWRADGAGCLFEMCGVCLYVFFPLFYLLPYHLHPQNIITTKYQHPNQLTHPPPSRPKTIPPTPLPSNKIPPRPHLHRHLPLLPSRHQEMARPRRRRMERPNRHRRRQSRLRSLGFGSRQRVVRAQPRQPGRRVQGEGVVGE